MTSLARIGGLFRIQDNPELDSLGNYPDLQEVHGTFSVMECGITALGTFPRLERVKSFTLFRCHLLTSLSGANLGYVEESVEIRENSGLTTLSGLQATIGGNLAIRQNIGLSDLVGMSVPSVGHSVQIWNNGGLTSLNGLSSIGDMGSLGIEFCGQLVDLQGIGTLPPYMDAVGVANNASAREPQRAGNSHAGRWTDHRVQPGSGVARRSQ